ncbi:MAG: ABC transporter ATP-binding protein [Planctomycetota bacterium]|nr:ABC transporter ATP-binding protein [Planctomycetota bacterium]
MRFARKSSRRRYSEYRELRRSTPAKTESILDEVEAANARRKRSRSFGELFFSFLGTLRPHRAAIALALGTVTFSSGVALLVPASTKFTIDYVLGDSPGPTGLPDGVVGAIRHVGLEPTRTTLLWLVCVVVLALTAASLVVGTWGRFQATRVTKRLQAELRRRAFEHAIRLPLHRVQELRTGGLASLLREDAGQAGDLVFSMVYNPWRAVVQLLGTLVVLTIVDWRMLLGAILLIPAVWISHRTWIRRIRPVFRDIRATRAAIDAQTTESFGGIRVVRGFGRAATESSRFVTANHFMTRKELLTWWWSRVVEIAWSIMIPLASAAVTIYAGLEIIAGRLSLGDLIMFTTYLLLLLGPLETLTSTATNIQTNLAAMDRVLDLIAEPVEFAGASGAIRLAPGQVRGQIEVRGVSFSYPKATQRIVARALSGARSIERGSPDKRPEQHAQDRERPVLAGISLMVEPGQTVALVGASGSGKTTLCNLIARFHDPSSGSILLDGIDLRDIDVESYRRLLGIVEQDVFLFDGSVSENIAYGRRDATPEQIVEAARIANADGFIRSMEQGYDTVIGERGVRLSGGQRQRIAIARAVLADPVILILDEATSNLDAESEAVIRDSLLGLMRGRTSFVIAHRLSTVRGADQILVLEQGRIVERGKHEELLRAGGRYAQLLRTQLEAGKENSEEPLVAE